MLFEFSCKFLRESLRESLRELLCDSLREFLCDSLRRLEKCIVSRLPAGLLGGQSFLACQRIAVHRKNPARKPPLPTKLLHIFLVAFSVSGSEFMVYMHRVNPEVFHRRKFQKHIKKAHRIRAA